MKKLGLLLCALLAVTPLLQAQVTVDLSLTQEQFLAGQAIPLSVRVVNRSGQTLQLGDDQDWLSFVVESKDGYVITKKGDVPVDDEAFLLPSAKQAKKEVDLGPYFGFSKPGRYTVTATVFIKAWNQQISSAPKAFDIISGSKMWEQEVGLPRPPAAGDAPPEIRRYALHQANYLKRGMTLFLQISDATGKIHKVFPVGQMVSFARPEPQVDGLSNLHLLYQDGKRSYNYTVVDPSGLVLTRQTYELTSRPRLKREENGELKVEGGIRRVKATDIPPPASAENHAATATP
ncbi:MAG TPA: hypothetical protein VEH04_05825 [Verrucomicrobiae bacterium]|nr:hypothetical protein [Verrucomicrobiae bacterium]